MQDIIWLDGKDATGMFILEITFDNGGVGFMKNRDFNQAKETLDFYWAKHPGIVAMKIYDSSGNVVANKKRGNVSVAC